MEEIGITNTVKIHRARTATESLSAGSKLDLLSDLHEEDLYLRMKRLERHLELLELQEEYIKDETRNLRTELTRAQEEVKRLCAVPLTLAHFMEAIDNDTGIIQTTANQTVVVKILSTVDREKLKPNTLVAVHRHSSAVVEIMPPESDSNIQIMSAAEKPDVLYSDIGGLDQQKQELKEAVELPLTHAELYRQIGIDPPRGVLLYGPPGCGKTMMVKAVANNTNAAFIRAVGSEFVAKYLGEGARKVRDVFRMARENAPSIVFIDEVDAIGSKRFDSNMGADREVQRILIELLNQMDGFDQSQDVKVIMATNRHDVLDPALLRPGRLDRKIEFPLPDRRQKRLVFQTITSKMNLAEDVDLETFIGRPDKMSNADIASVCQEAGMHAVRKNRYTILQSDLEHAYNIVAKKREENDIQIY
ncbi:26S protease regulatory subunit rpt3 [Ramicandelaber brevisporus]|nr:26S protease regulatory subunit rpt3 [Ramicandelaber brevisporus]